MWYYSESSILVHLLLWGKYYFVRWCLFLNAFCKISAILPNFHLKISTYLKIKQGTYFQNFESEQVCKAVYAVEAGAPRREEEVKRVSGSSLQSLTWKSWSSATERKKPRAECLIFCTLKLSLCLMLWYYFSRVSNKLLE